MEQKKVIQQLHEKCLKVGMCDNGKKLWCDDLNALVYFAKQESDYIFNKKPFTHKDIKTLFSSDYLTDNGVFVSYPNIKTSIEREQGILYILVIDCKGVIDINTESNIIAIGDDSDITINLNNKGFFTIKLFTNSTVNININANCGVLVLNYSNKDITYKRRCEGVGNITIKQM